MCMTDMADPVQFAHWTYRKARKPHRCDECRRPIQRNELYLVADSLYDRRWMVTKTCTHCEAAAQWLTVVCGGWIQTGLLEELIEHWHEGYVDIQFGRMIARMKHGWHGGRDDIPSGVSDLAHRMVDAARRSDDLYGTLDG